MTFEEWWEHFNSCCPLDITDEEIAKWAWDAATEQAQPEWISVEDRLPPVDEWVLFFDGDRTMDTSNCPIYMDKLDKRGEALCNYLHNYTHWMPLPNQPEEQE